MTELRSTETAIARQAVSLLSHYGFDLRGYTPKELASQWLTVYHEHWVRLAIIEALYLGRYKSISIEQILMFWARRQHPIFHFNHEFERLICRKLPRHLSNISATTEADLEFEATNLNWSLPDPDYPWDNPLIQQHKLPREDLTEDYAPISLSREEQSNPPSNHELASEPSIHRFNPPPDGSEFYQKLKAVAQQQQTNQETA